MDSVVKRHMETIHIYEIDTVELSPLTSLVHRPFKQDLAIAFFVRSGRIRRILVTHKNLWRYLRVRLCRPTAVLVSQRDVLCIFHS
jgi:hypothetical protein